jgi:catechol 2,3-dioxygenase-like lactoylglutathione lyase family enzyme
MSAPGAATASPALRLDHVQVVVPPELEAAAKRFYGGLLGLRQLAKPPGPRQDEGAWYDAGAVQLHLALEAFDPAAPRPKRPHLGFVVADLPGAERALAAAGVAIDRDGARFFVRDPAGNRIEVIQA